MIEQKHQNCIIAISTPTGVGGIAVLRMSGDSSFIILRKLFHPISNKFDWNNITPYSAHLGNIILNEQIIDQVIITLFKNPNSFTGEDIVEISCHGSIFIQQQLLSAFVEMGARMANPGEFTQRAFLKGKLDLSQAEAVADLIASNSAASHRIAMQQMRGGFSNKLMELREQLLYFAAMIELELDFSEEEVEFASRSDLYILASRVQISLSILVDSFQLGNAIKNGIPISIVGQTNAGKSTLLNYLLNDDKAIVSEIHGTTRDTIEDTVNINGYLYRFIDTAGIRKSNDTIEKIGIERTYSKMKQSQIVIWLIDGTTIIEEARLLQSKIEEVVDKEKIIFVVNKVDAIEEKEKEEWRNYFPDSIFISAKNKIGIESLLERIVQLTQLSTHSENDIIVSNIRHNEALNHALKAINRIIDGLNNNLSSALLTQDLRDSMHYLGEITGNITTDEILGTIFSRFCIGK